jgi:hypothetical protein
MIIHTRPESEFLARNMLDDSAEHDLYVYVPRGYEDSDRRYATAFLLHAFGESATTVVSPDATGERWRPPIEDVLDPVFGRMDNLRNLSGILLDAGFRDNYELQWGHRVLHHRLTEAGIAHDFTENPGNHGGRANERLQSALSWLGRVLRHE